MITDKQIEEAAGNYVTKNPLCIEDQMGDIIDGEEELSDSFKSGARWAIEEFLKGLWHDAKEEPKVMERVITHSKDNDTYKVITWIVMLHTWDVYTEIGHIDKWCYLNDLLPKEGGEECLS